MQSLPQLETTTFSGQIFWLFITFLILYFFISKFFLPKIFNIIFERENYFDLIKKKFSSFSEKIQKIKITNKEILEKAKIQVNEILKNSKIQKEEIKKNCDIEKGKLFQNLANQFELDIKNNFDLNKQNMYNTYIQINTILSKKLFNSIDDTLNQINESQLKINFDKSFIFFNKKNF